MSPARRENFFSQHLRQRPVGVDRHRTLFTRAPVPPERMLLVRLGLVLGLLFLAFVIFWLDRDGLVDHRDGHVSLTDVIYFTMVTITTVGYGDITPVSDRARIVDALLVTPIRLFIFLIFLGTAYEIVLRGMLEGFRMRRLQQRLRDHIVICGFGHTGRTAAAEIVAKGHPPDRIVAIDPAEAALLEASEAGYVGLKGDASRERIVEDACIEYARAAIVSTGRDDTNVLVTLTIRNLDGRIRIVAAAGEEENIKLLRRSGADAIIAPAKVGGYLLADAVFSSRAADCLCDLMNSAGQVRVVERAAAPGDIGRPVTAIKGELVVRIYRGEREIGFWDEAENVIRHGDRLLVIQPTHAAAPGPDGGQEGPPGAVGAPSPDRPRE